MDNSLIVLQKQLSAKILLNVVSSCRLHNRLIKNYWTKILQNKVYFETSISKT